MYNYLKVDEIRCPNINCRNLKIELFYSRHGMYGWVGVYCPVCNYHD